MKKNTNAVVLIYALVLSILMRILSIVISNKQSIFIDNLNYNLIISINQRFNAVSNIKNLFV